MKLTEAFDPKLLLLDLAARSKEEALREIARMISAELDFDERAIYRLLAQREEIGTTGMGEGVAVPHFRVHGLGRPVLGFARSKGGAEFSARDGKPVHLFAILMAPEGDPASHLQLLARVARLLRATDACRRLQEAAGPRDFAKVLAEEDARL